MRNNKKFIRILFNAKIYNKDYGIGFTKSISYFNGKFLCFNLYYNNNLTEHLINNYYFIIKKDLKDKLEEKLKIKNLI